jgi:hypothetical protein
LNNVDINFEKLIDLVVLNDEQEKKLYIENRHLETEKQVVKIDQNDVDKRNDLMSKDKDIKSLFNVYERVFSNAERNYLWKMFLTYSSDNVQLY